MRFQAFSNWFDGSERIALWGFAVAACLSASFLLARPVLAGTEDFVGPNACAECHKDGKIPRAEWTRITEPELNQFLLAPLAKSAGGNERCGKVVF
ncbi:MAG: hypothetical protein MI861_23545, partial [Pirellulales bacterium]|nr:hypothetical protein [Pirellulales bacterium]